MQHFGNWRFDVSGMTPNQIEMIIGALRARVHDLQSSPHMYSQLGSGSAMDEAQFLLAVAERLTSALPGNQPLPKNTVV